MINFSNGLAAKGIDVDLIAGPGYDDFRSIVEDSVHVIQLKQGMAKSIPYLRKYLRHENPDIMFSSQQHVNLAAILAKSLNFWVGTKTILRETTTPSQYAETMTDWKQHLLMFLAKRLFQRADHVIAPGEAARVDAVEHYGLDPNKTSTIYSSFTNPAFFESAKEPVVHRWFQDGSRVIASMGRVEPVKDFPTLVSAFAKVREQVDVKLMIIGETGRDPAHFDMVQARVHELNLQEAVDFVGFHQNPFPLLAQSEVYVLSSKYEGLPGALVQAMALGCKLVATDCKSGPREVLRDGTRGILVPVGDAPAMADAILKSLNTNHDRSLGQEWTSQFSETEALNNLIRVFENTLRAPSR